MSIRFERFIVLFVLLTALVFVLTPVVLAEEEEEEEIQVYLRGMEAYQTEIPYDLLKDDYLPGEEGPYLVTFTGPIEEEFINEVTSMGVQLVEYVPDFSFLVIITPEVANELQYLDIVSKVQLYQPAYKIDPTLIDEYGNLLINQQVIVRITTFGEDRSMVIDEITNADGEMLTEDEDQVVVQLYSHQLGKFAHLNSVKFIEVVPEYQLLNDVAKEIMEVDDIWNLGYEGTGQVVAVCDTGLDTGKNDNSMHADFQGRIDAIYALGRPTAGDASDLHGHGTHVAGSVLGSGEASGGQIQGMAPQAHLVFQSVADSFGRLKGIPFSLASLFQPAWEAGARIHTNSWGSQQRGIYSFDAYTVDRFVWNNDMVILFAAGNDGIDEDRSTLFSPGSAKNCITVGASENNRPTKGSLANDPDQVASFSSRGWASDGRVKPDIVAPGTWILSTRSSLAPDNSFWDPYNDYYAYMGGTSMATPLTAGAVAVARQYMQEVWGHTPSPAMMKAVLINGAVDMGYGFPSRDQGWGRINLNNSLTANNRYVDETYSLSTRQTKTLTYDVDSANTPFKVTLVWTDYPGSPITSKALVNDLDLKVTTPSGLVYYGNRFTGPVEPGTFIRLPWDRRNNVENVIIDSPEVGTYTVEVIGYNVPKGPQPFALYATADFSNWFGDHVPPTCTLTAPANGATVGNIITMKATATDALSVNRVEFYVDGIKVGTDTTSPYSYAWNSNSVSNGNHVIMAKAFDQSGNVGYSNSINVNVSNPTTVYVTTTFSGSVNPFQPTEHSFYVTATGGITISLHKLGLTMKLFNPWGVEVASGTTSINYLATQQGQYKLKISSLQSTSYSVTCTYPTLQ